MFAKGMTLVEVLIASFILGTAVLSMLALQTSALGIVTVSAHRQQASLLLVELSELVYISPAAYRQFDPLHVITGETLTTETCNADVVCTSAAFVLNELMVWADTVRSRLPDAQIEIQRQLSHGHIAWEVTLSWHGPQELENTLQAELLL